MIAVLAYSFWKNMKKKNDQKEELLPIDRRSASSSSSNAQRIHSLSPAQHAGSLHSPDGSHPSSLSPPIIIDSGDLSSRISLSNGAYSSSPASSHVLATSDMSRSTSAAGDLSSSDIFIRERMPRSNAKRLGSHPNGGESGDSIALLHHVSEEGVSFKQDGSDEEDSDMPLNDDGEFKEKPRLTTYAMLKLNAFWFG
ncbi:hypothetical protein BC829DRAFT_136357 [Chytridium lagenaria]|nr:hypothetical protein BC829DRAFT_136357 [Chytridium lagenaria]